MSRQIYNQNIIEKQALATPKELKAQYPLTDELSNRILEYRSTIESILNREDKRLILVAGPCSIHDLKSAKEYATKLKTLSDAVSDVFFVVMRVYFEKPRTTTGWKGFINDPKLNDSFDVLQGLSLARELLIDLTELGLPTGTEALDPIVPQYLHDLISWTAIGARTSESQTHREMASGISSPVGFKNGTDNNLDIAINAIQSASTSHNFLGVDQQGKISIFKTKGNPNTHVILRGGKQPNYDSVSIALCENALKKAGLPKNIVVDCSHGNSQKKPELQPLVLENCVRQITQGNESIVGMMLESHLQEGNQALTDNLQYGVSITDACIDWQTTEQTILKAAETLRPSLKYREA